MVENNIREQRTWNEAEDACSDELSIFETTLQKSAEATTANSVQDEQFMFESHPKLPSSL